MATTYAPNATTCAPNDFRPHNPFDDARRPASRGVVLALGVSLLVHGAIFAALWTAKFTAPLEVYSDQTTEVALLRAPPPPPSPPPELHLRRQAPPIVQPRPPLAPPVGIAAPPPLEIAPVVKPTPPPPAPPVVAVAVAPATVAPPARPAVIARPNWLRMPAAADVDRYYPERALRMGVTSKVNNWRFRYAKIVTSNKTPSTDQACRSAG